MQAVLKILILLLAGLGIVGWAAAPAAAYVLQGPHVLELMAGKLGRIDALSVTQKILLFQNNDSAPVEIIETLRYMAPGNFHSLDRPRG